MKKITSLAVLLITFLFLTSYAESVTDNLPKEFFDNADLYAKLEMIENLSIIEKVSAHDIVKRTYNLLVSNYIIVFHKGLRCPCLDGFWQRRTIRLTIIHTKSLEHRINKIFKYSDMSIN